MQLFKQFYSWNNSLLFTSGPRCAFRWVTSQILSFFSKFFYFLSRLPLLIFFFFFYFFFHLSVSYFSFFIYCALYVSGNNKREIIIEGCTKIASLSRLAYTFEKSVKKTTSCIIKDVLTPPLHKGGSGHRLALRWRD